MCIPLSIQMKWYGIAVWKSIVISVFLILTGLIGARLWYYVENRSFLGRSFYGVIFIAPIVFYPVAKILRIPYGQTMDLCAPAGCLTLAMVKIRCLLDGCCNGMVLYMDENRRYVRFPSQIVEMMAFLFIMVILLVLGRKEKNQTKIFPWFMILYGFSRFFLNFFREELISYVWGLSAGSFWSLIALFIGSTWLCILSLRNRRNRVM